MSGAVVQLAAKGVQDAFITGDPEVSFFRQSFKRHSSFANRVTELQIIGSQAASSTVSVPIPRNGDMLGAIWLEFNIDDITAEGWPGFTPVDLNSIAVFELYIGGQLIDRQDSNFVAAIWNKWLCDSQSKGLALPDYTTGVDRDFFPWRSPILPLHFWFCDGTPLPLVALPYSDVEVRITYSATTPIAHKIFANYMVLDTMERDWLAKNDMNLLITQVQRIGPERKWQPAGYEGHTPTKLNYDLSRLFHPVKALWFSVPYAGEYQAGGGGIFALGRGVEYDTMEITLDGHPISDRPLTYLYGTNISQYYFSEYGWFGAMVDHSSSMYSFAMKPARHVPTGSCNFSRIDKASMEIDNPKYSVTPSPPLIQHVYAQNWNILRIANGVGGIVWSS